MSEKPTFRPRLIGSEDQERLRASAVETLEGLLARARQGEFLYVLVAFETTDGLGDLGLLSSALTHTLDTAAKLRALELRLMLENFGVM